MENKKSIIAVTGATGNIGKPLIEKLIEKGCALRAVVRKPETNPAWEAAGVEQKIADIGDRNALAEAFAGADKIFSLSPITEDMTALAAATIAAAQTAGVKHIVRSSALGADPQAPIWLGRQHGAIEKLIEDSGLEWTFVQPASFFQNYLGYADSIKNENTFYAPLGDGKISFVDTRDIAAVAATALTGAGHAGKKYAVTGGESLSNYDIARIFSEVLAREISYTDVPEDAAREQMLNAKMPAWMVNAISELNAVGKAGYVAEIFPTVERVTGEKPRTFRAFVAENNAAFA